MELSISKDNGLLRELKILPQGYINFSTNDYLNFSNHSELINESIKATKNFGTGAGGSRLMAGNLGLHELLEVKLAELTEMDSALLYGSGFLTNMGVLTALGERRDTIFSDKLNHASLIDGAMVSRAEVKRYRHCDVSHLENLIRNNESTGSRIIVTDSLFSMDGDIAPLQKISKLAEKYNCILVVDEAHAIGVFGNGGGICKELNIKADVITGTLSKALGGYGGFVACSSNMREFFINKSRSFIYTTALPPSCAASAIRALEIIRENPWVSKSVLKSATYLREELKNRGFNTSDSTSQIVPIIVEDSFKALAFSKYLEDNKIIAVAIRPPTVPDGTARLRLSVTRAHSIKDLDKTISLMENFKWK